MPPSSEPAEELAARLAAVDARIADAAAAAGRDLSDLTRVVVTKFHPSSLVDDLYALGVRDMGENRQQEFSAKVDAVGPREGLRWHFIGQAQTNKARAIRSAASVVHSVDRPRLADALDAAGTPDAPILDVLLQVNLTEDPGRGGTAGDDLESLAAHVAGLPTLRVRGIMAVAPLEVPPARAFERLPDLSATVRRVIPDASWISAGMTADFAEAIAAGATHLRIGSAITGPRPERG